ncbi:MAG TPA: anthranilate synthase component I family protein, partial [Solirubrobacterales bacterium]|nr:anthranilate synthase component I family protein [Solirubrobacterales bacterium]
MEGARDAEAAFAALYGGSENAFWLDSSARSGRARFSFLGDDSGPRGALFTYRVGAGEVRVERHGQVRHVPRSIFDCLSRELRELGPPPDGLPFDFPCGFAGYLGYELKAECEPIAGPPAEAPDAALIFADRLVAIDHEAERTYLLALDEGGGSSAERWFDETSATLSALELLEDTDQLPAEDLELELERSRDRYLEDIAACRRYLAAGETYEVCLTNRAVGDPVADPFLLYRRLRRLNPAPFSAYLRFGDLAVLSSSPERFLRVEPDGGVEAKPIKGTRRRSEDPAEDARLAEGLRQDEKCRAENVTIVDLLRNDLGKVCRFGSVEATSLFEVETYETVHQLVSTVRGQLRPGLDALDCVRACFPPGSMTGAPKLRTMEILDELEGTPRGVYSGAIGYFGLGGGADLSVAIRTIVTDAQRTTVGAGGA